MDAVAGGAAGSALNIVVPTPDGNSGTLTVAPDGVEILIAKVEDAERLLRDLAAYLDEREYIDPPGEDPFSVRAVQDIRRCVVQCGEMRSAAQRVFLEVLQNLRDTLTTYATHEFGNVQKFRGGS